MEDLITSFTADLLHPEYDGTEDGYGFNRIDGIGSSQGRGYGRGDSSGCGLGYGDGYGFDDDDDSSDSGSGYGYSHGNSYGCGDSSGSGDGMGNLRYVKTYCGKPVYYIDRVPTMINSVRRGVAFGATLQNDLTTTPCVIVRIGHTYAHGVTLEEAKTALQVKLREDMVENEYVE